MATIIIPVRLNSYKGKDTCLDIQFYNSIEEFDDKPVSALKFLPTETKSMWIAVHLVDGKVVHGLTDYGYRSLDELKKAYKDEIIVMDDSELSRSEDKEHEDRTCQVCGKKIDECTCTCPRCGEKVFDDVTLADHGMCYDCLQKWKMGNLE